MSFVQEAKTTKKVPKKEKKIKLNIVRTFVESIHQAELKLLREHYGPLKRFGAQLRLLFLYVGYAAYSALLMLFSSSRNSFTALYNQDQVGTWTESYDDHIHLQRGLRLFSFSSLCVIVLSSVVIFSVVEFVFPPSATFFAQAADNTYTVTTSSNSGPGSLRTAINNANGSTGSVEIVLNIVGVDKTIELVTPLPTLTKPVEFTTQQLVPVIVDGESLALSADCFEIAAGAEGTTLVGMAFRYCPGNDLVVSAVSGITIGGDTTTEQVYFSGAGESGLVFGASNSTIMGVTAGYPFAVNPSPHEEGNALYGFDITGDSNTITDVTSIQNLTSGILIENGADGNTITNAHIGVRNTLSASGLGNDQDGMVIEGDNTTVGSSTVAGINTIADNAGNGIYVHNATGTTILSNYIGIDDDGSTALANGEYGVKIDTGNDTSVGQANNDDLVLVIANNTSGGIYATSSDSVSVLNSLVGLAADGSTAAGNAGPGMTFLSITNGDIGYGGATGTNGNNIAYNEDDGIQLTASTDAVVRNNAIYENTGSGMVISAGSGHTVWNNNFGTNNSYAANLGNSQFGLSIEASATSVNVGDGTADHVNVFEYNTVGGIRVTGPLTKQNLLSRNDFSDQFTGKWIDIQAGAQGGISTVSITGAGPTSISGTGAPDGGRVYIYADGEFIRLDDIIDASGEWSVSDNFTSIISQTLTAIAVDAESNTSEFSTEETFETEPRDLTLTDSTTFTDTLTVEAELDGGGTLYYTLDGSTPTTSSTASASPLSLEVDETTTLNIFGTDINANDTDIYTKTYTKESGSGGDDGSDGGTGDGGDDGSGDNGGNDGGNDNGGDTDGDDGSGDNGGGDSGGNDNGGDDNTVDESRFQYLKPTNMVINGLPVYQADTRIFVPRNDIHVVGTHANDKDQIRLIIKDNKDTTVDAAWENVEGQTWRHTVSDPLQKGKTYTVNAKVRIILQPEKESKVKTLATIVASNPAPRIATLTGDVTVTTQPEKLVFGGEFQDKMRAAVFKIQNQQNGEIVNECRIDDAEKTVDGQEGSCTLADALAVGQYRVLFHSLDHQLLSAPDFTQLIVTPAVDRSVFNTDERNADFDYRITTNSKPTVVGLGPEGALARVYLNDELVGEATYISAIGWQYSLDLSDQSRGKDYVLLMKFFHPKTGREYIDAAIAYPFHYGYAVVQPVVHTTIPNQIVVGTDLPVDIGGGAENTVRVYDNNRLIAEQVIIDNITGATGITTVDLPTGAAGDHTLTIQTEDFIGLKSAVVSIAYTVVSRPSTPALTEQTPVSTDEDEDVDQGTPGSTPTGSTDGDSEQTNNGNTNTGGGSGNSGSNNGSSNGGGTNSNSGGNDSQGDDGSGSSTNGGSTTPGDSTQNGGATEEIPEEWKAPVTTAEEQAEVRDRLNQHNSESLTVSAEVQVQNVQGEVINATPVEQTVNAPSVLMSQRVIGLKPLNIPGLRLRNTVQDSVVTFSGQTDPYAEVRLTIHSDPIVQVTRADAEGKWTMTVPVSVLPPGEHTASVQTTSRGVTSDEVQIAQFVVVEQSKISNTTWIFIINIAIAMMVLLVSIAMQIRYRGKRMANYTTPPIAVRSTDTGAKADVAQIQSIAQASEQRTPTSSSGNSESTEKSTTTHHSPLSE